MQGQAMQACIKQRIVSLHLDSLIVLSDDLTIILRQENESSKVVQARARAHTHTHTHSSIAFAVSVIVFIIAKSRLAAIM